MQSDARGIIQYIRDVQDTKRYRSHHWAGTFEDYLDLFLKNPKVARNSFQRMYDMILSYGVEEYVEQKEKITRYKFFSDPDDGGRDAIFGLDRSLMPHLLGTAPDPIGAPSASGARARARSPAFGHRSRTGPPRGS